MVGLSPGTHPRISGGVLPSFPKRDPYSGRGRRDLPEYVWVVFWELRQNAPRNTKMDPRDNPIHPRISGEVLPQLPEHDPYIFWKRTSRSSRICMGRVLGVAAELHQYPGIIAHQI